MDLTLRFLYDSFNRFNAEMFSGRLPKVQIKIGSARGRIGSFSYRIKQHPITRRRTYTITGITISNAFKRTQEEYEDTLIHEMIHLAVLVDGHNEDQTSHGPFFRAEMNRINAAFGRHINVREHNAQVDEDRKTASYELIIKAVLTDGRTYLAHPAKTRFQQHCREIREWDRVVSAEFFGTREAASRSIPRCTDHIKFYAADPALVAKLESTAIRPRGSAKIK